MSEISPGWVDLTTAELPMVLAIDIGSSSVKALVFDGFGRALLGSDVRKGISFQNDPSGEATIDANHLLRTVVSCIDGTLRAAGKGGMPITAVAVDTFVSNILGVNGDGVPITPLMTYADTRSTPEVRWLQDHFDEREVHDRTGCRFHPSYLPAQLRWLQCHDASTFTAVHRWLSIDEYLQLRLFGSARASLSVASWTGLLDRRKLQWDQPLLSALGISKDQLSPLAGARDYQLGLQPEFSARWPALGEVPWFAGLGDGAAANLGCGCTDRDSIALSVGTSSAMRAVIDDTEAPIPPGIWCYRLDGRRALLGGALTEGGSVYAWMRRTLQLASPAQTEAMLAVLEPDAHGLTVLPTFAGERSPGWHGRARASIYGLSLATRSIDILRAALEAIAYRLAMVHEELAPQLNPEPEIIASGAALLSSPTWLQIMADVLGQPLSISTAPESSARGAALLALEALDVLPDVAAAPRFTGATYYPDPQHHAIYEVARRRQEQLGQRLIPLE